MSLLFRTDASIAIGTGHVMRCIALAQAWQEVGGRPAFAMAESTPAIQGRLAGEKCEVFPIASGVGDAGDARETTALGREIEAEWIVVDGYRFGSEYQQALKAAGNRILFLDDYGHARHYFADLVLNQNVGADPSLYTSKEPHTKLLLGPRYALLRREFVRWREWRREIPPVGRRLLVMMGGSDPENITARVISALERFRDLDVTVVVGGSNPHMAELEQSVMRSRQKFTLREDVTNIPELIAAADVAISAAGSTVWELCLMGLPSLLIDVAANQTALARELDRTGCAVHVGDRTVSEFTIAEHLDTLLNSGELRRSLCDRSRALVDGRGANRVVSALRDNHSDLQLRAASAADSRLLWEWVNDPEVRLASFSPAPISWEAHSAWFAAKLSRDTTLIWIAENEQDIPCGQIRFDARPDGAWETDVSVAKEMRGRGVAAPLIALGVQKLRTIDPNAKIHAYIKPANAASVKAFEKASFRRMGIEQVGGNEALHLIYDAGARSDS